MRGKTVVPILALAVALAACDQAPSPTAPAAPDEPSENLLGGLLGGLLGWITDPILRQSQLSSTNSTISASAQGSGSATASGGTYRFAFAATRRSDGNTKGHARLRIGSTRYDADVTCLGVRGDTAVVVGVVRSSSDAGAVDDTVVFTAIENGGGDRIGEPEFPAAGQAGTRCGAITPSATTLAVGAGNIRVEGSTPVTGPVIVATVVGAGSYTFYNSPTNFQTNITRLSDGTVSGEYREDVPDYPDEFYVLTVSCVTVVGDTAYIGGTVTFGSGSEPSESGVIVVDNAPSAGPDVSTGITLSDHDAQQFCNREPDEPFFNLTSGDIAITP